VPSATFLDLLCFVFLVSDDFLEAPSFGIGL